MAARENAGGVKMHRKPKVFYHTTTAAAADSIAREGFKDRTGSYLFVDGLKLTGVWIANCPMTVNEGAKGETLLEIELAQTYKQIDQYEVKEHGKPYREWCVPATLLNQHAQVVNRYDGWVSWPD
jgi:hypothetical protein